MPQFYLKRFSPDSKSINIWNLRSKKKIESASLKGQCYKDYFYGKQLDLEKGLGKMEALTAIILRAMDTQSVLPAPMSTEHVLLVIYVLTQNVRTKFAMDSIDEVNDKLIKHLYGDQIKFQGIDKDQANIGIPNSPKFSLNTAVPSFPILLDLKYVLLVNKTDVDFVTSDNPVVLYNQLYSSREEASFTGYSVKGLQIFLPIGPKAHLIFYDKGVYSIRKGNSPIINVISTNDVHQLNKLQMCSALSNVYFLDKSLDVKAIYQNASPFLRKMKAGFKSFPGMEANGEKGELIQISKEDIRTNLSLSFLRLKMIIKERKKKKKFKKRMNQPVVILRNEKFYGFCQDFISDVDNNEYDAAKFVQYLKDKDIEYYNKLKLYLGR